MSELEAYYYYEDTVITPATHRYRVYHADEADKVFAEKDKELRRQKYKRCLDKADWCEERCCRYSLLEEVQGLSWQKEITFYRRLRDKYMEIAKKFKD